MSAEERQLLEEIREQNRLILAALERGGLLVPLAPPRRKGEPSLLQTVTEAEKMAQLYRTEGPAAMKAAMRQRNAERRAKRRHRGGARSANGQEG